MSILAEPRRKRKICLDPQNLAWKNDTNKFGHKMLQNMGWNEGQGLGLNNQGMTENIKLKANYTQKGIGAEASDAADRTWIAHHDEFSFLLEKLNAKKVAKIVEKEEESEDSEEEKEEPKTKTKKFREDSSKSLEEKSKATKTRIHYKFTKMKDLSKYSAKDKAAVIGVGLKYKHVEEDETKIKEKSPIEKTFEEPATVKNAAVSVTDYFAEKMAKFYAKKNGTEFTTTLETPEIKEEIIVVEEFENDVEAEERRRRKAEKKALKKAKREAEALAENIKTEEEAVAEEIENEEERRRQKAERKEQRRKQREARALAEEE